MNPQSRKWMLTINNPYENGMSIELIRERTELCFPEYYCGCVETATTGTVHVHLFVFSKSPIRFSTLQNRFPIAHIEKANGTSKQNRDYILKSGKWAETKKAETSVEGSFFEWGVMPKERDERQPKMSLLVDEIDSGKSVAEIIRDSPEFALKTKDIEATRQTLLFEKYLMEEREVKVIYLFGETGTGKTRSIYKAHPAKDVCRITDYPSGGNVKFDAYTGQPVLVFEEFHSQISIGTMLNYLDRYPLYLPARYSDRVACFNVVYITSNLPLEKQYVKIQKDAPSVWKAFLRRISVVVEFHKDGSTTERKLNDDE